MYPFNDVRTRVAASLSRLSHTVAPTASRPAPTHRPRSAPASLAEAVGQIGLDPSSLRVEEICLKLA